MVIQLPADDSAAPGYRIVAAMDIGFHLDFLAEFKRMLWWATGLVMCLALGGLAGGAVGPPADSQGQ